MTNWAIDIFLHQSLLRTHLDSLVLIVCTIEQYSKVWNKRTGGNKRTPWKCSESK